MAESRLRMTVSIKDVPEALAEIRHQVAEILREAADQCRSSTAKAEIRKAADAVELGLTRAAERDWT